MRSSRQQHGILWNSHWACSQWLFRMWKFLLFLPIHNMVWQGGQSGHSPVMIKFPDFSPTFLDISSDYLRGIDPRNSSDKKRNACYFMTFLWQLCSSIYSNGITSANTDVKLIYRIGQHCTFCVQINARSNWSYARTHFPWLFHVFKVLQVSGHPFEFVHQTAATFMVKRRGVCWCGGIKV